MKPEIMLFELQGQNMSVACQLIETELHKILFFMEEDACSDPGGIDKPQCLSFLLDFYGLDPKKTLYFECTERGYVFQLHPSFNNKMQVMRVNEVPASLRMINYLKQYICAC